MKLCNGLATATVFLTVGIVLTLAAEVVPASAQRTKPEAATSASGPIRGGSRIFVAPMEGGFDSYMIAGLFRKGVPLVVVTGKGQAEYEMDDFSEDQKWGIRVVENATGETVFAYRVRLRHYLASVAADICAAHLRNAIPRRPSFTKDRMVMPSGSKVHIAPMDGFKEHLEVDFRKEKVPMEVVEDKERAEFDIAGVYELPRVSIQTKVLAQVFDFAPYKWAAINIVNQKTGEVVFALCVPDKRRDAARECARQIKKRMS